MENIREQNIELNRIWKMMDQLYQGYASRCGLSPVAFWVLYVLHQTEDVYTQNAFAEIWFFPKQTVNSAISSLVKMGYVKLEPMAGARNSKAVRLTGEGVQACMRIIDPMVEAEEQSLRKMTEEERRMFLWLSEKQQRLLTAEVESIVHQP